MLMLDGDIYICKIDGDFVAASINGVIYQINACEYLTKNCPNLINVYRDRFDIDDGGDIFFCGYWLINNFTTYFIKNLLFREGNIISYSDFERNYDI